MFGNNFFLAELGSRAHGFSSCGLWALWLVGSQFSNQDRIHIPCTGRQIFNHWTTREVPGIFFFLCIFHLLFSPLSSVFERMTRKDFHPFSRLACCPSFMRMTSEKVEALQPVPQWQPCDPFALSRGASNRAGRVSGTHLTLVSFSTSCCWLCPGAGEGLHLIHVYGGRQSKLRTVTRAIKRLTIYPQSLLYYIQTPHEDMEKIYLNLEQASQPAMDLL